MNTYEGRGFAPGPDSLEYAASAQGIVDSGTYDLMFGAIKKRPRYPPGLPLLLSIPIVIGFGGEDLVFMTGLFAALNALLLASLAFLACRLFASGLSKVDPANCAIAAFAITGIGWALCPISIESSRYIMSDEATSLFGNAGLALLLMAFLGRARPSVSLSLCLLSGVCIGIAGALRPVSNYLLVGPGLLALFAALRLHGLRTTLWRSCLFVIGLAPVVSVVFWLLQRSGEDPWNWSAYGFWVPESYPTPDHPGYERTFNLAFLMSGNPAAPFLMAGRAIGHLEIALRLFLGLQFGPEALIDGRSRGLGLLWPWFGWMGGAWLMVRALRTRSLSKVVVLTAFFALAGWILGHVLLYSLYFFPAERFYIAPLSWCWVFTGTALSLLLYQIWISRSRILLVVSIPLLVGIPVSVIHGVLPLLASDDGRKHFDNEETRRMFARWLAWSDDERSQRFMPFDPVRAQALGLFDPELQRRIRSWGKIPVTGHRQQLIEHDLIPELEGRKLASRPDRDDIFPQGAREPGRRGVRFDSEDMSYYLWLEDLEGKKIVEYRVSLGSDAIRHGLLSVQETLSGIMVAEDVGLAVRVMAGGQEREITAREFAYSEEHSSVHGSRLISHGSNHYRQSVQLEFEDRYKVDGSTCTRRKSYLLRIVGRSLVLRLKSRGEAVGDPIFDYVGASVGRILPDRDEAGSIAWPLRAPGSSCFAMDDSFVSKLVSKQPDVLPDNELRGSLWLTLSRQFSDCLPDQKRPPGIGDRWTSEESAADQLLGGGWIASRLLGKRGTGHPIVDDYVLRGLRRALRSAGRVDLTFEDEDGARIALGPALVRGMGLENARMVFSSTKGLRIYLNKGDAPWAIQDEGKTLSLAVGGALALAPSGFILLSLPQAETGKPVVYASDPVHSEVLDTRITTLADSVTGVLPKGRLDALLENGPSAEVIIRDVSRWSWIYIRGSELSVSAILQPKPKVVSLRIDVEGGSVLSLGRRQAQLRCFAVDAAGRERELAGEFEWSSMPPGLVDIDGRGKVAGKGLGKVVLTARAYGLEAHTVVDMELLRVSGLRRHMISSESALVSIETGIPVHLVSLLLTPVGSSRKRIHLADSGPAGRVHMFDLDGLESGREYRLTMVILMRAEDTPMLIPISDPIFVR